jgi:hypothetical protein
MRALLLAVALVLPAAPLPAQTTAALRALWAEMPAIPPGERIEIGFGDLAAARALDLAALPGGPVDPALAQFRALPPGPWPQSVLADADDPWRAATGFGPGDVLRIATLSAPPARAAVIDLAPGAGAAVAPALAARGYVQATQGGLTAWARGEDFRVDLAARDLNDPFGGDLGQSSRVQVEADRIRQAVAWPVLGFVASARDTALAGQPGVAALLDALDRTKGAGALLGAVLWTDAAGLALADPLGVVTGATPPPAGPPDAWGAALFADLSDGPRSTGVLALTVVLPDAAAAEALRARVAEAWADRPGTAGPFAVITGGPAEVDIHPAGAGLWVLTLAQTLPTEVFAGRFTRNRSYETLMRAALMRDLVFLQP